jgi:hypothetical protein
VSSLHQDSRGTEPIDIAAVLSRRVSGRPQRTTHYTPRRRKPTAEQEPAIRALAAAKIPRPLASEFGVNHETIRTVLCQREPSVIV